MGENEAGKSAFCKIIADAILPDGGTITVEGKQIQAKTPIKAKQAGIGIMYQEFNLVSELSVYENLFIGKEICNGISMLYISHRLDEVSEAVCGGRH